MRGKGLRRSTKKVTCRGVDRKRGVVKSNKKQNPRCSRVVFIDTKGGEFSKQPVGYVSQAQII